MHVKPLQFVAYNGQKWRCFGKHSPASWTVVACSGGAKRVCGVFRGTLPGNACRLLLVGVPPWPGASRTFHFCLLKSHGWLVFSSLTEGDPRSGLWLQSAGPQMATFPTALTLRFDLTQRCSFPAFAAPLTLVCRGFSEHGVISSTVGKCQEPRWWRMCGRLLEIGINWYKYNSGQSVHPQDCDLGFLHELFAHSNGNGLLKIYSKDWESLETKRDLLKVPGAYFLPWCSGPQSDFLLVETTL